MPKRTSTRPYLRALALVVVVVAVLVDVHRHRHDAEVIDSLKGLVDLLEGRRHAA